MPVVSSQATSPVAPLTARSAAPAPRRVSRVHAARVAQRARVVHQVRSAEGRLQPGGQPGTDRRTHFGLVAAAQALTTAQSAITGASPIPPANQGSPLAPANQGSPLAPATPPAPCPAPAAPPGSSQSFFGEQVGDFFKMDRMPSLAALRERSLLRRLYFAHQQSVSERRSADAHPDHGPSSCFDDSQPELVLPRRQRRGCTCSTAAITEWLSLVMNKLGLIVINPEGSEVGSASGITDLWIGPKFNLYREEQTGTLASAGLTFQIPIGPDKVFQGTGDLSLNPYITVAQQFGKTSYGHLARDGHFRLCSCRRQQPQQLLLQLDPPRLRHRQLRHLSALGTQLVPLHPERRRPPARLRSPRPRRRRPPGRRPELRQHRLRCPLQGLRVSSSSASPANCPSPANAICSIFA